MAIHPCLCAVSRLVDELGTVPRLRPALDDAMQRMREDFPGDTSAAAGIMMLSEKLDILMSAYEQFLSDNKLGGRHTAVRVCAHVTEMVFRTSPKPAHLTVTLPGAVAPTRITIRRPHVAGGAVHIESDGYYATRLCAVFSQVSFVPSEETRLRTSPRLCNKLQVTRDEVHTFLVGLCTAEGVCFELELGQTALTRAAGGDVKLKHTRRPPVITRKR